MDSFAKRIKFLRNYLSKTRDEFGKFVNFPEMTIRSWEYKNVIPSNKSIQKLLENLLAQNITTSYEWLVSGEGVSPFDFSDQKKTTATSTEREVFLKNNPTAIIVTLTHDRFLPFFKSGDIIGGLPTKQFKHLDFVFIIKKDRKEEYDIKQLYFSSDSSVIFMMSLNQPLSMPTIYNKEKITIYKIVFKKDGLIT